MVLTTFNGSTRIRAKMDTMQTKPKRLNDPRTVNDPIFMSIFGDSWDELPSVMKKRYSVRPYTTDETIVKGVLDVVCKPPLLWMAPLMKFLGQIPACNETNVPVTVRFQSDANSRVFHFNRRFYFTKGGQYTFESQMLQTRDDEVIELMGYGICWRMRYAWDGEKVLLSHRGYALKLFGQYIPLPITPLVGAGNAIERAVDDRQFDMEVTITHPLLGKIYEYKGRFEVQD